MSETYIGAIKEHCPNATLTLDRFHLVEALQDAVDELRKEGRHGGKLKRRTRGFSRASAGYVDYMLRHGRRGNPARSTFCGSV